MGGRLPDDVFDQYQSIAGQLTRQYLEQEMKTPDWGAFSREQKLKAVDRAKRDARKDAREALMETAR